MVKIPELPNSFQGRAFEGNIWSDGCRGMAFLSLVGGEVTGWCFRILFINFLVPPSVDLVLLLSMWLPSSTRVRVCFSSYRKNSKIHIRLFYIYIYISLEEELRLFYGWTITSWLLAFPLFLHSLPFLISNWLNLFFGTQWKPRRLIIFFFKRKGRHRGLLYPGGPCRVMLHFNSDYYSFL